MKRVKSNQRARKRSTQSNFRLSAAAVELLEKAARESKLTKTDVIELCLVQYARTMPALSEDVKVALLELISQKFQSH